jgi:hypothetical protein
LLVCWYTPTSLCSRGFGWRSPGRLPYPSRGWPLDSLDMLTPAVIAGTANTEDQGQAEA